MRHESDEPYGLGVQIAALILFVLAGLYLKNWLLNGLAGPLFLVLVVYFVPLWLRHLARVGRKR